MAEPRSIRGSKSIAEINAQVSRIQREMIRRGEGSSSRAAAVYSIGDRYIGNAIQSRALRNGLARIAASNEGNPNYDWIEDLMRDRNNIRIPQAEYMRRRNNRR